MDAKLAVRVAMTNNTAQREILVRFNDGSFSVLPTYYGDSKGRGEFQKRKFRTLALYIGGKIAGRYDKFGKFTLNRAK